MLSGVARVPKANGRSRNPCHANIVSSHLELREFHRGTRSPLPGASTVGNSNLAPTSNFIVCVPSSGGCVR
jgi:hypothetical protein